jgi:hypothetical protein
VSESLCYFWAIVALLVLVAGWNHGWHHARQSHLTARLARASSREGGAAVLVIEPPESGSAAPGSP